MNDQDFRAAMASFATGVTVVTARAPDGRPVGVTVNAFSSVSLSPPLVLICLDRSTGCLDCFLDGRPFAVNILSGDQAGVSHDFAGPQDAGFHGHPFHDGEGGAPILEGVKAVVECRSENAYDGGDHLIVVGRVVAVQVDDGAEPLLYYRSAYRHLAKGEK